MNIHQNAHHALRSTPDGHVEAGETVAKVADRFLRQQTNRSQMGAAVTSVLRRLGSIG
jgi:ADP-ribose pyrophosphatase YjhB (NUDIX family)